MKKISKPTPEESARMSKTLDALRELSEERKGKGGRPSREEKEKALYSFQQNFIKGLEQHKEVFKKIDTTLEAYGLDREELIKACRHIKDLTRLQNTLRKVLLSLEYFREPKREKLEYLLDAFERNIKDNGFLAFDLLTEHIIPIVSIFGNARQRTAVALNLFFDMKGNYDGEPLITKEDAMDIRESILQGSEKDKKQFTEALISFDTLTHNAIGLQNDVNNYLKTGNQLAQYVTIHRILERMDAYMTDVNALVPEKHREELESLNTFNRKFLLSLLPHQEENKDRSMEYINEVCLGIIKIYAEGTEEKLSRLKGNMKGFEEWITNRDAWLFTPMSVRWWLRPEQLKLENIPEEYYRKYVADRIKRGEPVQDFMSEKALVPSYEDTITSAEYGIKTIKILNESYKTN